MDARLEVMHSKRPDRPLLATGRDRAEGRREEKLRELGALLPAKLPALEPIRGSHAGDASSGRTAPPIFQSVSFRQRQGAAEGISRGARGFRCTS